MVRWPISHFKDNKKFGINFREIFSFRTASHFCAIAADRRENVKLVCIVVRKLLLHEVTLLQNSPIGEILDRVQQSSVSVCGL